MKRFESNQSFKATVLTGLYALAWPVFSQSSTDPGTTESQPGLPVVKVTSDRQLVPRDESINPVRVLQRDALDALPVKDVTEAIATLPNVNIRRSGGADGEPSVGLYGVSAQPRSSSSTTLSIDGVPLNNGIFPEASLNILPLSLVERIEVIQGPASSAYGNNARLGVINLVTRRPKALGGEVSGSVASEWGTTSTGGFLGGAFAGGGNYLLGFDQRDTDGHLQPGGRKDFSNSALKNFAGFVDKAFGDLLLSAAFIRYDFDRTNPSYLVQPGSPAATNPIGLPSARYEQGYRQHAHVGAAYQITPQLLADLTYTHNEFDEQTQFNPNYGTPSGFGSTAPTNQYTASNGLIGKLSWELENNLLTVGMERNNARLLDRVANTRNDGETTGYFVQNRYLAFDKQLALSAGYRLDKFSFYGETSRSPKLGLVYKPSGQRWLIRANASRAFSAPSFNQLFGSFGNPLLVATTFNLREVGTEWQATRTLKLGATVFDTKTTNPIFPRPRNQNPICRPGAGNCFVNVGDVQETNGVTVDFEQTLMPGWLLGGSLTYLDPKTATFATSKHVLKLNTAYRSGPWTASAVVRRETERYFQDNFGSPFPDFTVVDISAGYRFNKSFELTAAVENLTNQTYATTQIVSTSSAFPALPINRPSRFVTVRGVLRF